MKYTQLTEEEQEINAAMDRALEALNEEKKVIWTSFWFWLVGVTLTLFSPEDSQAARIGLAVLFCALLCFGFGLLMGVRTRKHRRAAIAIMEPYQRRKALPFYQELTGMFADKPGVHLHLNDNGSITVTDKREKSK